MWKKKKDDQLTDWVTTKLRIRRPTCLQPTDDQPADDYMTQWFEIWPFDLSAWWPTSWSPTCLYYCPHKLMPLLSDVRPINRMTDYGLHDHALLKTCLPTYRKSDCPTSGWLPYCDNLSGAQLNVLKAWCLACWLKALTSDLLTTHLKDPLINLSSVQLSDLLPDFKIK